MPVASPPTLFTASGVWQDNLPHGEGKFIWATGEVLACKWRAGRPLSDKIVRRKKKDRDEGKASASRPGTGFASAASASEAAFSGAGDG